MQKISISYSKKKTIFQTFLINNFLTKDDGYLKPIEGYSES